MRSVLSLLAIVGAMLMAFLVGVSPARAASMPPADWSYYVLSYDTTAAYNLGCGQGTFDASVSPPLNSSVILDFGLQTSDGSGTIATFTGAFLSNSAISDMANEFARGYFLCTGADTTSLLYLGLGTNDSANFSTSTYTALGTAWANLMESIHGRVIPYQAQVAVEAANDIEDWSDPSTGFYVPKQDAYAWVNGYDAVTHPIYQDFGDANGCSQSSYTNTACASGYSQDDYYFFSWGAPPAVAVPEIYSSGAAWQWARISQYASAYHSGMVFRAPLDDYDIEPWNLTAAQAYADLTGDLSSVGVYSNVVFDAEIHCWTGYSC